MMLQRLATGATGVKQARYRRRPTRGSLASFGWTCYDNITQPCVMTISRSSADPLRAGLCAMITHGNIRNAPARSGSADDFFFFFFFF